MYRNLEAYREPKNEQKVTAAEVECVCQCKAPAEQGKEPKPAGTHTGNTLQAHLDQNR